MTDILYLVLFGDPDLEIQRGFWAIALSAASLAFSVGSSILGGRAQRKAARAQAVAQAKAAKARAENLKLQLKEFETRSVRRMEQYLTEEQDLDAAAIVALAGSGVDVTYGSSLLLRERAKLVAQDQQFNLTEQVNWKRLQAKKQIEAELSLADNSLRAGRALAKAADVATTTQVLMQGLNFAEGLASSPAAQSEDSDATGS